jgi:hypothetical protein
MEDDDQAAEIEEDEDEKCPAVRFHLRDEAEALNRAQRAWLPRA